MTVINTKKELCEFINTAINLIPSKLDIKRLTEGTTSIVEVAERTVRLVRLYSSKGVNQELIKDFILKYQTYILDTEEVYLSCENAYTVALNSDTSELYDNAVEFIWKANEDLSSIKKSLISYRITLDKFEDITLEISKKVSAVNNLTERVAGVKIFNISEKGIYMTSLILNNDWLKLINK